MADENEHLAALQKRRAELVERRRQFVTAIDLTQFLQAQSNIEAIDRAIEDEEKMQPSVYKTRGLRQVD